MRGLAKIVALVIAVLAVGALIRLLAVPQHMGSVESNNILSLREQHEYFQLYQVDYITTAVGETVESVASSKYEQAWETFGGADPGKTQRDQLTYWFRLNVAKAVDAKNPWWMVVDWPMLQYLRLHIYNHDTKQWRHDAPVGMFFPSWERPVIDRNFILPLDLPPGAHATVYVELRNMGSVVLPMSLWRRDVYVVSNQVNLIFLGLLLGSIAAMMVYNLGIFTVLKDKAYLYYSIYGFTTLFYLTSSLGIGALYIWGRSNWMNMRAYPISVGLCFFAAVLFAGEFLSIRRYGGWLRNLFRALLIAWFVATACAFFLDLNLGQPFVLPLMLVTSIVGLAVPIYLWVQGNEQAKYFAIAWSFLVVGAVVISLSMAGLIRFTPTMYYTHLLGFSMEVMLLAYALANRINHERRERMQAQAETLRVQQELNNELEKQVEIRTEQLNETLGRLEDANEELTRLSVTDSMTKIYNRRFFDRALLDESRRAYRTQQPISILLIDIDRFKTINDNYGHAVGDQCLKLIASTLASLVKRSGDLVARYGGEEFVCILPATDLHEAELFAETCRGEIGRILYKKDGVEIKMTASIGVAAGVPENEDNVKSLVESADKALYEAKTSGRDRVVCATKQRSFNFEQLASST